MYAVHSTSCDARVPNSRDHMQPCLSARATSFPQHHHMGRGRTTKRSRPHPPTLDLPCWDTECENRPRRTHSNRSGRAHDSAERANTTATDIERACSTREPLFLLTTNQARHLGFHRSYASSCDGRRRETKGTSRRTQVRVCRRLPQVCAPNVA